MPWPLSIVAVLPLLSPQEPAPREAVAALTAAVDAPTPDARAKLARELSARTDVTLAMWVAAARELPLRDDAPAAPPGGDGRDRVYRTTLTILGFNRAAAIHVRVPTDFGQRRGPMPLLFVWHSASSDGAAALAAWTPLADRFGFLLAAPTETNELYRPEGWSYHPDGYEGALAALRFVRRNFDVDEDRIVIAGVRGGGHMAWDVGARYCDRFAAVISANGAPRLGNAVRENNLTFLEQIAHLPIRSVRWGEVEAKQDGNTRRAIELLRRFGNTRVQVVTAADEREALAGAGTATGADAGWAAIFAARRSVPAKLVRYADLAWYPAIADWGRNHWLEILRTDGKVIEYPPKVPAAQWSKLDEQGKRSYLDDYVRERTPRLEASMNAPGRFAVDDRGIERFRLLLTPAMIGAQGKVVVTWRGHTIEKAASPSSATFLLDFVERLDRTFLPTAAVVFP